MVQKIETCLLPKRIGTTTIFSFIDGVPWPQPIMHIKRTRHTQFCAPIKALKEEFWLYPAIILRLSKERIGTK